MNIHICAEVNDYGVHLHTQYTHQFSCSFFGLIVIFCTTYSWLFFKCAKQPFSYLEIHQYECLTECKREKIKIINECSLLPGQCHQHLIYSFPQAIGISFTPSSSSHSEIIFIALPTEIWDGLAIGRSLFVHFIQKNRRKEEYLNS